MKTIDVARNAQTLNKLLDQARKESLILRCSNGEKFIVAEITDFDHEIELTRGNEQLTKFLDSRVRQRKRTTLAEIKRR